LTGQSTRRLDIRVEAGIPDALKKGRTSARFNLGRGNADCRANPRQRHWQIHPVLHATQLVASIRTMAASVTHHGAVMPNTAKRRQIVLDTETTGLSADHDRIVEIGCVELVDLKPTGNNLHFYLNPERSSHEEALKVHGLTDEFLSDMPKFAEVAAELLDYLRDAELIIHNAPFDTGFFDKELERIGEPPLVSHVAQVIDTLAMARARYPGKRNSLDALCDRLGVDRSVRTRHGALLDAGLLADVYVRLAQAFEKAPPPPAQEQVTPPLATAPAPAWPMNTLAVQMLDRIQEMADNPGDITGVPTGFHDLDSLMGGMQAGELIVLGARPSMGKTALALNIVEHVALVEKLPVAVFSMERSALKLTRQMAGSLGRINQSHLRTGQLTDREWPRLTDAVDRLREALVLIDDTPHLTITQLRDSARHWASQYGKLGLIVVDSLQSLRGTTRTEKNRADTLAEASHGLKALAQELECPVLALSHLKRSVEMRADKRPMLSDLRGSRAIEQDADVVLLLYRDDYYDKGSLKPDELIIAKPRYGRNNTVKLFFVGPHARFENLADASLIGADLERADLVGKNLAGQHLGYANLSGANLKYANLSGADLSHANLAGANLSHADLAGAILKYTELSGANLYETNLADTDLSGVRLRHANLENANLDGAHVDGHKLIGERPIFTAGPIGSRDDHLTAWLTDDGLMLQTGCFFGTRAEFEVGLIETHGIDGTGNEHAREYRAALELIKVHAETWTPRQEQAW
jgi:DNA polymerase III epsilon subunit